MTITTARLFAILEQIDRTNTDALSAIWGRLAAFLELHAKAEEEIFYPALLQAGLAARRRAGVEDETLDAIGDHNQIRTRSRSPGSTRSAATTGAAPWPPRTWRTVIIWPRKNARA